MDKQNFKFVFDEAAPVIPPMKEFNALLAKVNAKKPWYNSASFWSVIGSFSAIVATVFWFTLSKNKIQIPKNKHVVKIENTTQIDTVLNNLSVSNLIIKHAGISHSVKEISDTIKYQTTANIDFINSPIATAKVDVKSEINTSNLTTYNWFNLPYDTFFIENISKPGWIQLSKDNWLQYPADCWTNANGEVLRGKIKILFRLASDESSMIFSRIYYQIKQDGKYNPIENNGSFEILAMQDNKKIEIAKNKMLIVHFNINKQAHSYSGLQYSSLLQGWDFMSIGDSEDSGFAVKKKVQTGYSIKKSKPENFLFWIARLFSKPHYIKLPDGETETPDQLEIQMDQTGNNIRAYEIHETGWFGNGRAMDMSNAIQKSFHFVTPTQDSLTGIYQIFIKNHAIVFYPETKMPTLQIIKTEPSVLIAFFGKRNRVAFLDADRFEKEIKLKAIKHLEIMRGGENRTEILLDVYSKPILKVEDLQKLIKSISNLPPAS
jgi:hypothetical protein